MKEFYEVKSYDQQDNYHVCLRGEGKFRLDLMACGELPTNTAPESLVGKIISCDYTHPFISIAEGVKIEDPAVEEKS